ncbi:SusD/RagB family nutrient-binding outer membrane lipoprotein [Galbibacter pacificus]|uniref:SusD/RagB family nutrient-binding outer membrane lipoprotein n=1 Tax=Galbibacter pacificus TaxID=2996052 RepID=A0ABT6FRM1_9FLAO|nr:SusD/RagB family nutrient-binding outer membrane lipoprotein [Galbibacter pacificus]MDG3582965.1 SusD/RagB family nutrient-binding outer membrane lipoprotein [Galbibacter pacificus]MDG3585916.1 SusD/RagB family nutrient-binding outer membrane lipoprotein [Galbibacter pacificus]
MKKLYITILFGVTVLTGCSNFDEDINTTTNDPSQASGMQLISQAELWLPGLSSSPQGEFMAQYLAETQYVGLSLYPQQSTSFYSWYQGPLADLQAVLNADDLTANEGPIENQLAVAKILKAYYFWNITDRWGDVPYSEALQGVDDFTPAYDTQESIYTDLFAELKEASDMMVSGNLSNDIVYDGDMGKWERFANTIRMIMALRLSEVNPATAEAEFNNAVNDGVFISNDDNLFFQHLADANNQNYWYDQVENDNREWWALTESLVSVMKPLDDPRLPIYGNPARDSDEYVGLLFGEEDNIGTEEYSLLGDAIYAQDAPVYLLTYAQVQFAMAEASERGWITGDTETYYNQAIESSIEQWTGSTEEVTDFMAQSEVAFDPANAMEQIATQRWVHLYMFGYEAWAEWRRTGLPDIMVKPNGVNVPTRLAYPDNEAFNNETNYTDAVQRQFGGEDSIYGTLWWDK